MLSLQETITSQEVDALYKELLVEAGGECLSFEDEQELASVSTFRIALEAAGGFAVSYDGLGSWVLARLKEKTQYRIPVALEEAIDLELLAKLYMTEFYLLEVNGFLFYAPKEGGCFA